MGLGIHHELFALGVIHPTFSHTQGFFTGVKRRKTVSPEGSLHNLCVPISVQLLQFLGRTWQELQVLVNVFLKVLIKKLFLHYAFSHPVLSHHLFLQLNFPLSICSAHGVSLDPVTCNDVTGTAQVWFSILNELLKHLVHHSGLPHRFVQKHQHTEGSALGVRL